jgi:MFS family permease
MTLVTGVASAMYWATVNALVQEVIPPSQFTAANAAVLIGVQSGLLIAGAFVGFTYDRAGIAGILAIDGFTYFVSAYCLYKVRRGYVSPREHQKYREYSEATEATAEALSTGENPEVAEAGISLAMYADLREGFQYLKQQPLVRALGITHSILMAGVVSANVVLVALTSDVLHAGARGLGYLESGWRPARSLADCSLRNYAKSCASRCTSRHLQDWRSDTWPRRSSPFFWPRHCCKACLDFAARSAEWWRSPRSCPSCRDISWAGRSPRWPS